MVAPLAPHLRDTMEDGYHGYPQLPTHALDPILPEAAAATAWHPSVGISPLEQASHTNRLRLPRYILIKPAALAALVAPDQSTNMVTSVERLQTSTLLRSPCPQLPLQDLCSWGLGRTFWINNGLENEFSRLIPGANTRFPSSFLATCKWRFSLNTNLSLVGLVDGIMLGTMAGQMAGKAWSSSTAT